MKLKRKKISNAKAPEAPAAASVEAVKRSPHADTHFVTGELGLALADANDAAVTALKAAGIKPVKEPVSQAPFTRDPRKRAFFASFVTGAVPPKIVWPDVQAIKAQAKQPMDEETKAYLRERGAAKRFLRPKVDHSNGPVAKARAIFAEFKGKDRATILAACVNAGINPSTAAIQLGRWAKANGVVVKPTARVKTKKPAPTNKASKKAAKPAKVKRT